MIMAECLNPIVPENKPIPTCNVNNIEKTKSCHRKKSKACLHHLDNVGKTPNFMPFKSLDLKKQRILKSPRLIVST